MKKFFASRSIKHCSLLIVVIGLAVHAFGTLSTVNAQNSCYRVAPESCYKVRKQNYPVYSETWHGSATTPHCAKHTFGVKDDTINLKLTPKDQEVCTYLQTKNPQNIAFDDCEFISVRSMQVVIKSWHLDRRSADQKSTIWPDANWSLRAQDYTDYYTHPSVSTKNFSLGQTLSTQFWYQSPTSRLALDCNMNTTSMLDDGYYGYCTRMALQLYLNEDCVDYEPPIPHYVFGRDTGDQELINIPFGINPPNYGRTPSDDPPEQVRMCVGNVETAVLIVFKADKTYEPYSTYTLKVCEEIGLNKADCTIDNLKKKTAQKKYGDDNEAHQYGVNDEGRSTTTIQQKKFKSDLSSLLVKNCSYNEIVIGRKSDEYDLFLETQNPPDTEDGLITEVPDEENINNHGFAPDGSIQFCKNNKIYDATMFFDIKGHAIFEDSQNTGVKKGAAEYICKEHFGFMTKENCTLESIKTMLANEVYGHKTDPNKNVIPFLVNHPAKDTQKRLLAHYLLKEGTNDYDADFSLLPQNNENSTSFPTDINVKNHNAFKQELSQYLTANCRANPTERPAEGAKEYTINYCNGLGEPDGELKFWYNPDDKLLSGPLCKKLDDAFKGVHEMITNLHASPMAQIPEYARQIEKYIIPTPPTDFLLKNGSCRLEDLQKLTADGADYYFFRGDQVLALKTLYETYQTGNTSSALPQKRFLALEWLSANAFAEEPAAPPNDHPVILGQMDQASISVIENLVKQDCKTNCVSDNNTDEPDVTKTPKYNDFKFPWPCAINQSFQACMDQRKDKGINCNNDCAPGYIKNDQGVCVSEDFFGWQKDHLRPRYQIGANWDDYEYKGDARDITYWGQRFGAKAINFLAITTVLFIMIAVLRLVLSGGASDQITKLKQVAQWSVLALLFAIFAYVIVKTAISMTYWG